MTISSPFFSFELRILIVYFSRWIQTKVDVVVFRLLRILESINNRVQSRTPSSPGDPVDLPVLQQYPGIHDVLGSWIDVSSCALSWCRYVRTHLV